MLPIREAKKAGTPDEELPAIVDGRAIVRGAGRVVQHRVMGNLIFASLEPPPTDGLGAWPGPIERWTNVSDDGDVVALTKKLGPLWLRVLAAVLLGLMIALQMVCG